MTFPPSEIFKHVKGGGLFPLPRSQNNAIFHPLLFDPGEYTHNRLLSFPPDFYSMKMCAAQFACKILMSLSFKYSTWDHLEITELGLLQITYNFDS